MNLRIKRLKKKVDDSVSAESVGPKKPNTEPASRYIRIRQHPLSIPVFVFFLLFSAAAIFLVLPARKGLTVPTSKIVILTHDGQKQTIPTTEPTVGVFLQKLNIHLGTGDVVEPATNAPINQDDFRINIYRAKPVEIVDGGNLTFTFSAATTTTSIVQQSNIPIYPEDIASLVPTDNFLTDAAIGERIVINRASPVNVNIFGAQTVIRTRSETVGSLLSERHITLAKDDSVVPAASTPISSNLNVYLIHKGTQIITVTQSIPMPVQTIQDSSLAFGTSAIRQAGSLGQQVLTYQLNLENGKEVSRSLIQTVVAQQPATEIVAVGNNESGIKGDMGLAGISPSDYQYADYIISNESGWCPTKAQGEHYCPATPDNAYTSNGYGLCQATPGYKMQSAGSDWATNPITQLSWCSGYASSRYGGWYAAYLHWVSYHNW